MSNNNPSVNPADLDHLAGAFGFIFKKLMQGIAGVMPVQVIGTDGKYVTAQHLIMQQGTSGEYYERGQIAKVPILQLGGGGYIFNIPVTRGDLGLIIACDRDISAFLQKGTQSVPNTTRIKDFADSFFIPCVLKGYTIASEDLANAVIQTLDGSVKVSIGATKITLQAEDVDVITTADATVTAGTANVTASEEVNVTSPVINVNATDTLNLNVSGFGFTGSAPRIIIDSPVPVQINNDVYVDGDIIATGDITPNGTIPPV